MSVRTKVVERNTGIYNWGKEHPVIYRQHMYEREIHDKPTPEGGKYMRRILSILIFFLAAFSALSVEKIVVAVMQDPDFLDPHRAAASGTYEMMFNVFEGLLKPDSKGNVVPAIAGRESSFITAER